MEQPDKSSISGAFRSLQDDICNAIEGADGSAKFQEDIWNREEGGGGRTRVLEGKVIEKGAVNFSEVFGELSKDMIAALKVEDNEFFATGVSIILHPVSPMVPIIHMNVRYFELGNGTWWFGGGIDLTPHYINPADAGFFHASLKQVCDKHPLASYEHFKEWADDYFFIPHRNETRGVGGIFFDRLGKEKGSKKEVFDFVLDVGRAFAPTYITLMEKNRDLDYGEKEKEWQYYRRGRYVEFNLVYDLGTKFGLKTNGRIESILLSLPKRAGWEYNYVPEKESNEEKTLKGLKKGINWLDYQ